MFAQAETVRLRRYRRWMPQWIVLLALAIVGWLLLTVVGGIALGRLLALAERRRSRPLVAPARIIEPWRGRTRPSRR
jgi:hypothetical protein